MAETPEQQFTRVFIKAIKDAAENKSKKIERNLRRLGDMSPSEGLALCFLIIKTVGDQIREQGGGDSTELAFIEILEQTTGKSVLFQQDAQLIPKDIDAAKKASA